MNSSKDFLTAPRFIVIGGHKCGTSSLHYYLKQHPDIAMPKTKGQDLLNKVNLDIKVYEESYEVRTSEKIFGEVSSSYFESKRACQAIKQYFPNSKLLIVLRNPVDRAFSNFNGAYNAGKIKGKFEEVIHTLEPSHTIIRLGFYYKHLKPYLDNFEQEQLQPLVFDDFVKNKEKFYQQLFQFIEVDENFVPDTSVIIRKGGVVKYKNLQKMIFSNPILSNPMIKNTVSKVVKSFTSSNQRYNLRKKVGNMFVEKKSVSNELRASLIEVYREDILKTQELLDIDLSHWFNIPS